METDIADKLSTSQYGFRRGRSTADALAIVIGRIKSASESKSKMYGAFVDFAKAFDSVKRDILIDKLRNTYNMNEDYIMAIQSLLSGNTICLNHRRCPNCGKIHGPVVEISQTIGVMQGDSLSPFLFVFFIDDIVNFITSRAPGTTVVLYADDLVILAPDQKLLQSALDALKDWTTLNLLEVNVGKTKVMKFRRGGRLAKTDVFNFGTHKIDWVNEYVYLGVTLQPSLCFSKHIKRVKTKAVTAIALLSRNLSRVSLDVAKRVFESKVKPVITYSMHIFASCLKPAELVQIDIVKNSYMKRALCLPASTNNEFVHRLFSSPRLCEELDAKGFNFQPSASAKYYQSLSESKERDSESKYNTIVSEEWKGYNKPRHFILGYAAHGFHFKLCTRTDFHRASEGCVCKYCNQPATIDHLASCTQLKEDIYSSYTFLQSV